MKESSENRLGAFGLLLTGHNSAGANESQDMQFYSETAQVWLVVTREPDFGIKGKQEELSTRIGDASFFFDLLCQALFVSLFVVGEKANKQRVFFAPP